MSSPWGDSGSAIGYDTWRRRRRWSMGSRNGLQGYAAYLSGAEFGAESSGLELPAIISAETAAYESGSGSEASRAILIGVTTGVVTFLLNRWLGKVLK